MLCTALEILLFLKSVGLDKKGHTNPRPRATRPNILNTIRKDFVDINLWFNAKTSTFLDDIVFCMNEAEQMSCIGKRSLH